MWDCLFLEGSKILFRVGLMLVKYYRNDLLACDDIASMSECLKSVVQRPFPLNCHIFIKVYISTKLRVYSKSDDNFFLIFRKCSQTLAHYPCHWLMIYVNKYLPNVMLISLHTKIEKAKFNYYHYFFKSFIILPLYRCIFLVVYVLRGNIWPILKILYQTLVNKNVIYKQ